MVSFDLDVGYHPPAIVHSPHANHVFVPKHRTVEIWEVSMTSSNIIFETEPLTTSYITSICPSRDGHRLLVGSGDGTVRMWNMENLAGNQSVTQDDRDIQEIIAFSPSGKMMATKSQRSTYIELRDTTTWELIGPRDVEPGYEVAFSADDNRIAVLSHSLVTIRDIMHPENHLSFDPWPQGRNVRNRKIAFQTCNDLVICAKLRQDDSDEISGLLQVWELKDHSECMFSLDVDIGGWSPMLLAPDGLTVISTNPVSCYSWNHNTAQFRPFHFTDEVHLGRLSPVYSPDGKLFACHSWEDNAIRVWDTRIGQLCGKPITMPNVHKIALSPALNDRSLGDQLIALRSHGTNTINVFDVHTHQLYAQCWDPGWGMRFIRDGTKLASYQYNDLIKIHDIADPAAKRQNATRGFELILRDIRGGWVMGQDNELLFWVPLEHRQVLCLAHVETIWGRPIKVDLSNFKSGTEWTECIDQEWLTELEERRKGWGNCLSKSLKRRIAYSLQYYYKFI